MQLDSPLHAADDMELARVFEAGVFAGLEDAEAYHDGPWGLINGVGGAFAKGVDLTAKIAMLVNALGGMKQLRNIRDGKNGTQTGVLLALAFAPTVLRQLRERTYNLVHAARIRDEQNSDGPDYEELKDHITTLAMSGRFKQEIGEYIVCAKLIGSVVRIARLGSRPMGRCSCQLAQGARGL